MKVYLLRVNERRHVFYSEGPESVEMSADGARPLGADRRRGLRNFLERKVRFWQLSIARSKRGVGSAVRAVWDWLQRFVGPDETLLRGLRSAKNVNLHHPSEMGDEAARAAWTRYLKGRWVHHLIWLLVDLLLSIGSLALMILPGPNVIGFWLVYRTACHGLALIGVRRATHREVITELEPIEALDLPVEGAGQEAVDQLADRCGLKALDVFLVRVGAGGSQSREEVPAGGRSE